MEQVKAPRANCSNCRHFYITWDVAMPYGCRAMGFKSKLMPYMVTKQFSQTECLSYQAKADKEPDGSAK